MKPIDQPGRAAASPSAAEPRSLLAQADDRTLRILEHRRRTGWARRRGWLVKRALLLSDLLGLTIAFGLAQVVVSESTSLTGALGHGLETLVFLATLPLWVVVAKLYGLYDRDEQRTDHTTIDDLPGVFHLVTVGAWVFFAGAWLSTAAEPDLAKFILFWGLSIVLVMVFRGFARAFCRRTITYLQNTVIVGADDVGQLTARKILRHPEYGINLVGFVDGAPHELREEIEHVAVLGRPDQLLEIISLFDVERVIVTGDTTDETLDLVRSLKDVEVVVDIVPQLFELMSSNAGLHTIEGLPMVSLPPLNLAPSSRLLKRTMDVVVSAVALLVLSPVFLLVAIAIELDSRGSVFFRQVRMGALGKEFTILKFRTMNPGADARRAEVAHLNVNGDPRMFKARNDPRVTRVGRFLRRTSLDELPQLWNVLRGQMSLVGPRPLPLDEDCHVGSWARRRLDLRPGMTGLWQISGRSELDFDDLVRLDFLYLERWSVGLDLAILLKTVPAVISRRGAF